jgi:hypothetical protein
MLTTRSSVALAAIASVICLLVLLANSRISAANRDKEYLAALSESIVLGSDREAVLRQCNEASRKHGWAFTAEIASVNVPTSCVETGLRLGATNWVLYVSFIDDRTAAIMVRTSDTPRFIPEGAPPDRIQDQARDFWKKKFTR